MAESTRLIAYNLTKDAQSGLLSDVIGRDQEIARLTRIMNRQYKNNVIITGAAGAGKTALVDGFVVRGMRACANGDAQQTVIRLDTRQIAQILRSDFSSAAKEFVHAACASLGEAIVVFENLESLMEHAGADAWKLAELYEPFFENAKLHAIATVCESAERALFERAPELAKYFEVLRIAPPPDTACEEILAAYAGILYKKYRVKIDRRSLGELVRSAKRLRGDDAALPEKAIHLFDEALASCAAEGRSVLTPHTVHAVVSERGGAGLRARRADDALSGLEDELGSAVIGQDAAVASVSRVVRRGQLGLRSPHRPRGSFLFLGPSGVGKTELAKSLAHLVFDTEQSLIRLDMSEFGEAHMVQRLIGSPPGFVGHESGGQLTNQVAREPYSLVLLDEIEKAHPKVFDIFLQILDDGRLTDGHGKTVDFTQTIIIMTSNIGIEQIVEAHARGIDVQGKEFLASALMPLLTSHFRLEFLNRFDHLAVFNPLTPEFLTDIALLEIKKIEERLARHQVRFQVSRDELSARVGALCDPRFGARPVKRFVEELCERMVEDRLLKRAERAHNTVSSV